MYTKCTLILKGKKFSLHKVPMAHQAYNNKVDVKKAVFLVIIKNLETAFLHTPAPKSNQVQT